MKPILQPGEGEVLKLGPPLSGELIIKVDPQHSGGTVVVGTQTIPPGGSIPVHRHLHRDHIWFVHKGQGRVTVDQHTTTVLPGMTIAVPREHWQELRNTGTGLLQLTWTSAPAGIEGFFRELSQRDHTVDAVTFREIAGRYGIELRPESEGASAPKERAEHPHHRRHRGRRHRGIRPSVSTAPAQLHTSPPAATLPVTPVVPTAPSSGPTSHEGRRPFPRRPRRTGPRPGHTPPSQQPTTQAQPRRPAQGERRPPHRYQGRVKEVYMNGRWIRVVGEGPVISPGRDSSMEHRRKDHT